MMSVVVLSKNLRWSDVTMSPKNLVKNSPRIVTDNQTGYIFLRFQIVLKPLDRGTVQL